MKSIRLTTLGFTLVLASLGLGNAGCADSDSMIYVRQVQARLQSGTSVCNADNSPSSPALGSGVLDVQYRSQYTAALLVGSQLVPRGSSTDLRTETARVMIEGTIVHALDDTGNVIWGPVSVPGSGFIEPATDTTPSYGLTETTLFQASAALSADLQANPRTRHLTAVVKVFGKTLGGTQIESGEWQFPLTICFRCLIAFPIGTSVSTTPPGDCDNGAPTGVDVASPCNPGQDDTLDCRACKALFQNSKACDPAP
jgi:hypothetical protein